MNDIRKGTLYAELQRLNADSASGNGVLVTGRLGELRAIFDYIEDLERRLQKAADDADKAGVATVLYDANAATVEDSIRRALITLGWTPPVVPGCDTRDDVAQHGREIRSVIDNSMRDAPDAAVYSGITRRGLDAFALPVMCAICHSQFDALQYQRCPNCGA